MAREILPAIVPDVAVWERALTSEVTGRSRSGETGQLVFAAVAFCFLALITSALTLGRWHGSRRIQRAGYVKVCPPDAPPRYVHRADLDEA